MYIFVRRIIYVYNVNIFYKRFLKVGDVKSKDVYVIIE